MILRRGYSTSYTKEGMFEVLQMSAHTISGFGSPFGETTGSFKTIQKQKQHFFAGVMTKYQELENPKVPKQLTDLGFVCVERFRNKHFGNILCYYRRMPEKLLEFKESEDGMGIVVTS